MPAVAEGPSAAQLSYEWTGEDDFSHLNDRKNELAVQLPPLKSHKRIVLVRHGQSTWNAEGRIQGSTDFAVLTPKGQAQAQTTHEMLCEERFDKLFHSPLRRAAQTADIVWSPNASNGGANPAATVDDSDLRGPRAVLPSLREIDLYSFQGLLKAEGQARYGAEFRAWQKTPADFSIDAQHPVRELWHRASCAWHTILLDPGVTSCALVVAHNAVNQALVATAVGLPPTFFRRLLQSNAASTVLDFAPVRDSPTPSVTIDRLNQSPDRSFIMDSPGAPPRPRIILLRHAATASSEASLLTSSTDEAVSSLGEVQAVKAGEFLMDTRIESLLVSPADRAVHTAAAVAKCQSLIGNRAPRLQVVQDLANIDVGGYSGRAAREVQNTPLPADAEALDDFWARTLSAWDAAVAQTLEEPQGTTCVVAHALVHAALICHCLGLGKEYLGKFRMSTSGLTVLEFPFDETQGVVRCHNYTAHLGRWAVPISRDNEEALVCGIDGCF